MQSGRVHSGQEKIKSIASVTHIDKENSSEAILRQVLEDAADIKAVVVLSMRTNGEIVVNHNNLWASEWALLLFEGQRELANSMRGSDFEGESS